MANTSLILMVQYMRSSLFDIIHKAKAKRKQERLEHQKRVKELENRNSKLKKVLDNLRHRKSAIE